MHSFSRNRNSHQSYQPPWQRGNPWVIGLILSLLVCQIGLTIWLGDHFKLGQLLPGCTSLYELTQGHVWTLVSHLWVHQDGMHLVINLIFVFLFGRMVERKLSGMHMGLIFLASGIAGALLQISTSSVAVAGASGAWFGLLGAVGALRASEPAMDLRRIWLSYANLARGVILAQLVFACLLWVMPALALTSIGNTAWLDHFFGGVVGWAFAKWMLYRSEKMEREFMDSPPPRDFERLAVKEFSSLMTIRQAAEREGEEWKLAGEMGPNRMGLTLEERVDRILDKINRSGRNSLSPNEHAVLEEAAKRLKEKGA